MRRRARPQPPTGNQQRCNTGSQQSSGKREFIFWRNSSRDLLEINKTETAHRSARTHRDAFSFWTTGGAGAGPETTEILPSIRGFSKAPDEEALPFGPCRTACLASGSETGKNQNRSRNQAQPSGSVTIRRAVKRRIGSLFGSSWESGSGSLPACRFFSVNINQL